MILVNRLYTVLSVILIILVTVFYLIYISKYDNREYVLYMQSNSTYPLQQTAVSTSSASPVYKPISAYDTNTSSYNQNYYPGRVYFDAYEGYSKTGRYVLVFSSQPSDISFNIITSNSEVIETYSSIQLPGAYYPLYLDFHVTDDSKYIDLQYYTTSSANKLYKLSVEFF